MQATKRRVRLGWFFFFLILYLVAVGPVNYLVLRKMGRKELAWLTIPIMSIAFSLVAYGLARGERTLDRLKYASVHLATEHGSSGFQLVALSSSGRDSVSITFPSRSAQPVPSYGSSAGVRTFTTRTKGAGATVETETVPFSVSAVSGGAGQLDGHIDARLVYDGKGFFGKVTNKTPYRLTKVSIVSGRDQSSVGDLDPGESAEAALVSSAAVQGLPGRAEGMMMSNGRTQSRFELLKAMFEQDLRLDVNGPIVLAEAKGVAPGVTVDGGNPGKDSIALIASPVIMDVEEEGSSLSPAAGRWWIADFEGHVQGFMGDRCFGGDCGGMGIVNLNNFKEVVFAYQLPSGFDRSRIAGGRFVTGENTWFGGMPVPIPQPPIIIDDPAQPVPPRFGGRGEAVAPEVAPPQPALKPFRMQVYDWAIGQWVEGDFGLDGTQSIPPNSFSIFGEAFIKLISDNQAGVSVTVAGIEADLR